MTVTPLGRDQDCSLKNREPDVLTLLVPGSWRLEQGAVVGLYFIFPGICTLSLVLEPLYKKHANKVMLQLKTLRFPIPTKDTVMVPTCTRLGQQQEKGMLKLQQAMKALELDPGMELD
ncbi:hypothetical protein STEG23_013104 [Scotinomys teguina]